MVKTSNPEILKCCLAGENVRFPVFQVFSFPPPFGAVKICRRPDAPDAAVIAAPLPGTHPEGRARLSTRGQECHALGRFGVSPARTPSDPPPSARRDSGVASVKVRLHKRHNTLSTIKISTINAQFNDHYARKGSVPGRYRPPRKGADKITLKILQVCA